MVYAIDICTIIAHISIYLCEDLLIKGLAECDYDP